MLYIGGFGRSGTTLVDRMLGEQPNWFSAGELVHLWTRGVAHDELCGCGRPFSQCELWSEVGHRAFGGWGTPEAQRLAKIRTRVDRNRYIPLMLLKFLSGSYQAALAEYQAGIAKLYEAIAYVAQADVIVDSSKHASTAFLLRKLPHVEFRVVHLVRDSRGVAYSWAKSVRRPEVMDGDAIMPVLSPIRSSAKWVFYNLLFHLLRLTKTPVRRLRYEDIVSQPRDALTAVSEFVSSRHVPGDASPELGGNSLVLSLGHTVAGNPMRFHVGKLPLIPDHVWHSKMPTRHRLLVTIMTSPLLLTYNYIGPLRRTLNA